MLKEVIGDDEVDRLRLEGRQQLTVIDDINWRQIQTLELRVVRAELGHGHSIDIPDTHARRQHNRQMQGPNLDPAATQQLSR